MPPASFSYRLCVEFDNVSVRRPLRRPFWGRLFPGRRCPSTCSTGDDSARLVLAVGSPTSRGSRHRSILPSSPWAARKQSFISFVQVELRASPSYPHWGQRSPAKAPIASTTTTNERLRRVFEHGVEKSDLCMWTT